MRIYLDSSPIIYVVEQTQPFFPIVDARISAPGVDRISSELARMECLIMPIRGNNLLLANEFKDFFQNNLAELLPLSRFILDRAAEIRACHQKIKTADAIHLAAAIGSACDVFLTNDHRLANFPGVNVELI
jgi:predicted nucleic acid-binding protein